MKIIIADDEGIVLSSCRRILEVEGFEVLIAVSVDEALRLLDQQPPACPLMMLVDVKMPVHDGMYLIRKVKERRPELPIFVMSGYATPETEAAARNLGAVRFIAKPFTPEELLETLLSEFRKEPIHEQQKSTGH